MAKGSIAAGIEIPKYAYGSRLGILRALDDAVHGYPKKDVPAPLKSSAIYYFGSLQKASVAAKRERATSPKGRITTALSRMHRGKQSLGYTKHAVTICRWCVPPRSSSGVGVRRCMPRGLTQTCIMFVTSGAERYPNLPSSSVLGAVKKELVVTYQLPKRWASYRLSHV